MIKKIVFFGGTFDPPHKEHIEIALAAERKYSPDKLIIMPTAIPPHKSTFFSASGEDRLNMCRIAFSGVKSAEVSDMEIAEGGKSYSYITIERLKAKYPEAEIIFVMGTDMLKTFAEWKNPERILRSCRLALVERSGDEAAEKTIKDFNEKFSCGVDIIDYVGKEASSTEYKISKALGLPTEAVTEEVGLYIDKTHLYEPNEYFKFVKEHLTEKRLIHTKGVILSALKIAKKLGVDINKTITAAVLHDCAKYLDYRDYKDFTLPIGVPESVIHQFLGGYIAEKVLKVKDREIIDAITYHTSGRVNMSTLEKIIYTADMIEQGRNFDGVEDLRKIVESDFEEGFRACLKRTAEHLKDSGKEIYPETLKAVNYYLKGER